jgi:hypothetical protein
VAHTVYWYVVDRLDFTTGTPSFHDWKHRHLLALKAMEKMSPHFLLIEKKAAWLFSKHQCGIKCNILTASMHDTIKVLHDGCSQETLLPAHHL